MTYELERTAEIDEIEREILRARGAFEQVGGAVAREGLRDATAAFDLAAPGDPRGARGTRVTLLFLSQKILTVS